jgi:hypothetical protein
MSKSKTKTVHTTFGKSIVRRPGIDPLVLRMLDDEFYSQIKALKDRLKAEYSQLEPIVKTAERMKLPGAFGASVRLEIIRGMQNLIDAKVEEARTRVVAAPPWRIPAPGTTQNHIESLVNDYLWQQGIQVISHYWQENPALGMAAVSYQVMTVQALRDDQARQIEDLIQFHKPIAVELVVSFLSQAG